MKGGKDDKGGKKTFVTVKSAKKDAQKPAQTMKESAAGGKQAKFFDEPLSEQSVITGMETSLAATIHEDVLNAENRPKYFHIFLNEKALNDKNQFTVEVNNIGHEELNFHLTNKEIEMNYDTKIGKLKIVITGATSSSSGVFKVRCFNDVGDFDETSGNLKVLGKQNFGIIRIFFASMAHEGIWIRNCGPTIVLKWSLFLCLQKRSEIF